jgi:hypothetical protein
MTTPPITRRCPFCGATAECLSVKNKCANGYMRKYVHCDFCGAHGPWCSYEVKSQMSIEYAIAACVFDWNYEGGIRSWDSTRLSTKFRAKRAAFIVKWSKACKD